jgi:hypothetical protein
MNITYHVFSMVADDGIWVSSHVIEELINLFLGIFSQSCLLCGNVREGHEDSGVHCQCIVEEAANNLLDSFLSSFVKEWTVICWIRSLIVLAVIDRIGRKGTMLWFQKGATWAYRVSCFITYVGMERSTYCF